MLLNAINKGIMTTDRISKGGLFVETRKATAECIVLQFQPSCKLGSTVLQCSAQRCAFFVNLIVFPYERVGASQAVNFRSLKK